MAKTPTPWQPSQNPIDCSETVCTHFFPPPAFAVGGDDSDDGSATASGTAISPVIIAIIAAVVAALLLLLSYLFLSRRRRSRLRLRPDSSSPSPASAAGEIEGAAREARREPEGLDETLISRIAACKYRRSEGLVGGTDCTVCLTEFQEGESLRLLPECGHAFHVPCIDTWLKNHSNCPICRAGIVWMGPAEERVVVVDRNSGRGRGGN